MTSKSTSESRKSFALSIFLLVFFVMACGNSQSTLSQDESVARHDYQSTAGRQSEDRIAFESEKRQFELERLAEKHQRELKKLAEQHQQEMDSLKATHRHEINRLTEMHQAELRQLAERHQQEVDSLKASHLLEIENLESIVFIFKIVAISAGGMVAASWIGFFFMKWRRGRKRSVSGSDWEYSAPPKAGAWKRRDNARA